MNPTKILSHREHLASGATWSNTPQPLIALGEALANGVIGGVVRRTNKVLALSAGVAHRQPGRSAARERKSSMHSTLFAGPTPSANLRAFSPLCAQFFAVCMTAFFVAPTPSLTVRCVGVTKKLVVEFITEVYFFGLKQSLRRLTKTS